jgi:hypothetical protein
VEEEAMRNINHKLFMSAGIILLITVMALSVTMSIGQAQSGLQQVASPTVQSPPATPTVNNSLPVPANKTVSLPEIYTFDKSASFTFKDIGAEKIVLTFPSGTSFGLNLPDYWNMAVEGSYFEFHYDFEADFTTQKMPTTGSLPNSLDLVNQKPPIEVAINNVYIGAFFPEIGKNQKARVLIPAQAWAAITDTATNPNKQLSVNISFFRNLGLYCGSEAILSIYDDSRFVTQFTTEPPTRDLSILPRTLVQGSFLPETLLFVIPDEYSDGDLTTVSNLIAFVSRGGQGNVKYKVLTSSQANQETLKPYSAVVLGQPSKNTLIKNLYQNGVLPTKLNSDGSIMNFDTSLKKEAGVIQLIPSPYNPLNTFLVVTGNSDDGLVLASEQLNKTTNGLSSIVYVFDPANKVNTAISTEQTSTPSNEYKLAFNQLNFRTEVFRGYGIGRNSLSFYVPRDWEIQSGAKIILNYNFSARLSAISSALAVSLNGYPIGSLPFDRTIQGDRVVEISLSPKEINRGVTNVIDFAASLKPELDCTGIDPDLDWITIRDNSVLDIPYRVITNAKEVAPFTNPFDYLANEKNLLVVMPQKPTEDDLVKMGTIISRLGGAVKTTESLNIVVTKNPDVDLNQYKGFNLLAVGRASQNPILTKYNDVLLQQFVPGQDILRQQTSNLEIHTPQDINIGLVQVVALKEDPFRGLTVFSGTTPQGMQYGIDASENLNQFDGGDLFYISANNNVMSYLSSFSTGNMAEIISTAVQTPEQAITAVPVATASPLVKNPSDQNNLMNLSPAFLLGVIGAGVLVIILGVIQVLRKRVIK